jgi:hypothetical protein
MAEQTARNALRTIGLGPDLGMLCTMELNGCVVSAKAVFPDIYLLLMRLDFGERAYLPTQPRSVVDAKKGERKTCHG